MKRLLLLHTGGTLGMTPLDGDLKPGDLTSELFRFIPEAQELAEIDVRVLYNIDSSNVQIAQWQLLAAEIERELDRYDGFVIIHGTDTMVYTASALSFMLTNLPKPVILTGAQRPIAAIRTDAKNNLIGALELATYDVPEVGIYFDHRLFRGNRAKKLSIDDFDAFASPNFPVLAQVGLNIELRTDLLRRPSGLFRVSRDFSDQVVVLRLVPGMAADLFDPLLDGSAQAFVLEAFGAGNVPITEKSVIPFIERAVGKGKIVALASQSPSGAVDLELYECGSRAAEAGAVSCADMTVEAAAVKLMYLLGQFESRDKVQRNFPLPLAGECR
jgi:L-asparaginase